MRARLILAAAGVVAIAGFGQQTELRAQHAGHGTAAGASQELHAVMQKSHEKMPQMKMTGDVDHDFATMMVMHHQAAIDMADIELAKGGDPTIKEMARKIKASQAREIKEFKDWLAKHQAKPR